MRELIPDGYDAANLEAMTEARAYPMLHETGLLKARRAGAVSRLQIRCFDALFELGEPVFAGLHLPFGKNCWVLARRPYTHRATLAPTGPLVPALA
jgi:hypothetical protein